MPAQLEPLDHALRTAPADKNADLAMREIDLFSMVKTTGSRFPRGGIGAGPGGFHGAQNPSRMVATRLRANLTAIFSIASVSTDSKSVPSGTSYSS